MQAEGKDDGLAPGNAASNEAVTSATSDTAVARWLHGPKPANTKSARAALYPTPSLPNNKAAEMHIHSPMGSLESSTYTATTTAHGTATTAHGVN